MRGGETKIPWASARLASASTCCAPLGLDDETLSDERLIESMLQHPILINRPIVVTPLGTRLCRPSEVVLEILTQAQEQPFRKEDGEWVAAASDQRLP